MKKKNFNSLSLNKKSISNLYHTVQGGAGTGLATFSCDDSNVTKCGICPVPSERGNCLTQIDCPLETEACATLDWRNDPICFSFRVCL